ncbi:MAG: LysR family transcriptional regulator [Methanosphaera sp.]|nr:LysR family transcriptional regulator [Methanosphaera sp.]
MNQDKKLSLTINDTLFDYKLFDTLNAIDSNNSQRGAAKELGISHTVLNRRILNAEDKLEKKLVVVSPRGSFLTDYAKELLNQYEVYEHRLEDMDNSITVVGGSISCEFIRQLSLAYNLGNIHIIETDLNTAFDLTNRGLIDILAFDDPVQAYVKNLDPIPLGRDSLLLLLHDDESISSLRDLNGLQFVEVENSAQRLAWTTLANYDIDFDIVRVVKSFHEAIRIVENNENLYTFINKSMSYRYQHTSNIISKDTQHIISALNVKNDSNVENFLNFASHQAQKTTVKFGFEQL